MFSKSPKLCKSNCKQGCFCFCSENEGYAQGRKSAGPEFPNQGQIEPTASSAPSIRKACVESVVFRRNHHFLIRWCTTHTLFTNNENLFKSIKDPLIQYIVYLQALVEIIFTWWVLIASDTIMPLKCFLMNLEKVPTNQWAYGLDTRGH